MKIGFIGLGNMATALISGMLTQKKISPEDILGSSKTETTAARVRETMKINAKVDNLAVARESDILFLAIKPSMFPAVIEQVRNEVKKGSYVVSIAAGLDLNYLKSVFSRPDLKFVRCMSNTPALVLEGCTAVCAGKEVSDDELAGIVGLLEALGKVSVVPEQLMDVVVGVSGSSPAYVFMFIEALADAAVAGGMPRQQAYEFVAQSVMGSAKLMIETGLHPGQLKDMVCSPGGTTIQAVKVLEERGMRGALMAAVDACVEKSRNMSN